eukprot:3357763-Rhodomonas_salina.1
MPIHFKFDTVCIALLASLFSGMGFSSSTDTGATPQGLVRVYCGLYNPITGFKKYRYRHPHTDFKHIRYQTHSSLPLLAESATNTPQEQTRQRYCPTSATGGLLLATKAIH